ncbi:hypothetical protein [uncultured Mediterranean phage uvMED]|nr:hypothetical protein [uncultured Mediterranean phage uvMED]BAR16527.1 hypothetical protein [uncultured Mediterranean phage uvMED]
MCDPVTLSIAAGSAAGYGSFVAGAGAISAGAAVGIGLTVGMGVMQYSAARNAQKAKDAMYDNQVKRANTELEQENLEMLQNSNIIGRKYQKEFVKLASKMSGKGIALGSASYKAQFETLGDDKKDDLSLAKLSGLEKMAVTESYKQDILTEKSASRQAYKTNQITNLFKTGRDISVLGSEFSTAPSDPDDGTDYTAMSSRPPGGIG